MSEQEPRPTPEWINAAAEACSAEVLIGGGSMTFARIISEHSPSCTLTPEQVERARKIIAHYDNYTSRGAMVFATERQTLQLLREVVGHE